MAPSRVELFEQIRRDRRVGGLSVRELAENRHVHRPTVRQALASAVPPPRKAYARAARAAIDACVEVIDSWLLAGRDVPRKQRHTAADLAGQTRIELDRTGRPAQSWVAVEKFLQEAAETWPWR